MTMENDLSIRISDGKTFEKGDEKHRQFHIRWAPLPIKTTTKKGDNPTFHHFFFDTRIFR